ncbi:MAG: hypothetical protein CL920_08025 [Deltaproteobacteria bacterium]|nr:hypothetical protein [Deltaproteobacteria bacterium]MBU48627.1 hypothetical protein [Deltaproteobacteria bacterium]
MPPDNFWLLDVCKRVFIVQFGVLQNSSPANLVCKHPTTIKKTRWATYNTPNINHLTSRNCLCSQSVNKQLRDVYRSSLCPC